MSGGRLAGEIEHDRENVARRYHYRCRGHDDIGARAWHGAQGRRLEPSIRDAGGRALVRPCATYRRGMVPAGLKPS